jgi:ATP-binding cassette subfamily C (CFTR/MRP) protein 1
MKNTTCDDAAFGPVIDGCRPFDFTIAFELYIFSIIPSAIFLLVAPLRLVLLSRSQVKVEGLLFHSSKLVSTLARDDSRSLS